MVNAFYFFNELICQKNIYNHKHRKISIGIPKYGNPCLLKRISTPSGNSIYKKAYN